MSLSETPSPGESRVLDEVRAKIFYLASDVEPASQPAAMLLRAVAESIIDASEAADHLNGHATMKSVAASLGYPRLTAIHPAAGLSGADTSRSGHKR